MRSLVLPLPKSPRRWSVPQRRTRRPTRFALCCEPLESRQLLSTGQTSLTAGVVATLAPTSAQVAHTTTVSTTAESRAAVSSFSNIVSEFGSPGGQNFSQVGYLLSQLVYSPTGSGSTGVVATTAPISGNPAANLIGNTLTLTNLSVTILNPDMTSTTAAVLDTQVNSDAYLVPSTTDLLDDHLGKSTAPAVTLAPVEPTPVFTAQASHTVVNYAAGRFGSNRGQSAPEVTNVSTESPSFTDFVEPFEPAGPAEAPQAQPVPQGAQPPPPTTTPETPSQSGQAPPANAAPAAPRGGQAPGSGRAPQAAPEGGQGSGPATAENRLLPPISDPDVDAVLDLADARVLTRSSDGDAAQPDDHLAHANTSWSFSAIFGVTALATGGYHLAMGEAARLKGRWIPRWSGAERPTRRKTGTASR